MRSLKFSLSIALILLFSKLSAQNGFIRGVVFDATAGDALIGVTVVAEGTISGALTDLDGKFNLSIAPGTYNLKVSYISFESTIIEGVKVKSGEVTLLDNINLKSATVGLGEVTVTAAMTRNTESSILSIKMNSPNLMDGISSANFRKIGDSDAAASMKRIPGVSIEGGKYVYVRGLGDRYTKTIVNGVDIPGLDPDRNTMQMDIFPTNIIDNIIVHKSFSAELPADFTGGVIDIATKDFPEQKKGSIQIGTSYNPDYHFKSNYLTYQGSKTDFLGFDNGWRDIPATENIPSILAAISDPTGVTGQRFLQVLEGFNPTMAAMQQKSLIDYNFGATFGNQIPLKKITLGYNFGFSYKSNTEFYENAEYGRYGMSNDPDVAELEVREFQIGNYGINSVLISGLAGFAVKTQHSKFRINLIHLQNGESKAGVFDYEGSDEGSNFVAYQHNLEYNQRALTNLLIDGKHSFPTSKWDIIWKLSPTISSVEDPDTRFVRYNVQSSGVNISAEAGFPERIWRSLSEINLSGVIHFSKEFTANGEKAKINFGGAYTFKDRDFLINKYTFKLPSVLLTGDPDEIFRPENLWPLDGTNYSTNGTYYEAAFIPKNPNQFNANSQNIAAYLSTEISIFKGLRAVAGVRMEKYEQRYTGENQGATIVLNNDKVLDDINLFPTINLIYAISGNQNLRFSYANTIARPSFKELSYADIADPVSGRTFSGGMHRDADGEVEYWDGNLVSTSIHNLDLRWEIVQKEGQMISLSAFYKYFIKPIEIVQYAKQPGSFQPRNVGNGQVSGLEVEFRQNLGLFGESFKKFQITSNISVTESMIELSLTEYVSRIENARTGQTIDKKRVMAGQAPYIINSGISYAGASEGFFSGLEAGVYYNVQGTTLQYVGISDRPDIYTLPFHSLNLSINKSFGKEKKMQLGFKIDNLLNDKKESVFRSFNPTDQFFTKLEPGITYHLKLSYALF